MRYHTGVYTNSIMMCRRWAALLYRRGVMPAFILLIAVAGAGSAIAQSMPPSDTAAIRRVEETFRSAWLSNDEVRIMSLFHRDAALFPGPNPPLRGKDALRGYWFGPSDTRTTIDEFQLTIDDIEGNASFATVSGSDVIHWSTMKRDGSETKRFVSRGHYLAVYTKAGGRWLMLKRFAAAKTEEIKGDKK